MDISAQTPEPARDVVDPLDRLLRPPSKPRWWPMAFERLMAKPAAGDTRRPAVLAQLRRRTAVAVGLLTAVGMGLVVLVGGAGSQPAVVSLPRAGSTPSGVTVPSPRAASGDTASGTGADSAGDGRPSTAAVRSLVTVHVAGAVATPGLVHVGTGGRVADALAAAGGARPDADLDRLNLAAPLMDGVRVYVPLVGQPEPAAAAVTSGGGGLPPSPGADVPAAPIDINIADASVLDALPGVGPSTASAIVAYRSEHGRFSNVDELQEVRGIGPAKFEALQDLVVVG